MSDLSLPATNHGRIALAADGADFYDLAGPVRGPTVSCAAWGRPARPACPRRASGPDLGARRVYASSRTLKHAARGDTPGARPGAHSRVHIPPRAARPEVHPDASPACDGVGWSPRAGARGT